jgi:CopG antitoxin of type II toxin-antitoxin system
MDESKRSSISRSENLEGMGEFWDTHDFTDYDNDAPDVEFEIQSLIPIEPELMAAIERQARLRGVKTETLVNLWLHEKLVESSPP